MKKTFWKTVDDIISYADIVLYVLDARFPSESRNKDVERLFTKRKKSVIYVFTKFDIVSDDESVLVPKDAQPYVIVSAKDYYGIKKLKDLITIEAKRTKFSKPRVGVVGYPNIGKSSLINALAGKKKAKTSSDPGYTKGQQYIATPNFLLIDTPGVIPRLDKDEIKHIKMKMNPELLKEPDLAAMKLMEAEEGVIEKHFGIAIRDDKEETLEEIARLKNLLRKGNEPDLVRAGRLVLKLYNEGLL